MKTMSPGYAQTSHFINHRKSVPHDSLTAKEKKENNVLADENRISRPCWMKRRKDRKQNETSFSDGKLTTSVSLYSSRRVLNAYIRPDKLRKERGSKVLHILGKTIQCCPQRTRAGSVTLKLDSSRVVQSRLVIGRVHAVRVSPGDVDSKSHCCTQSMLTDKTQCQYIWRSSCAVSSDNLSG